MLRGLGFIQLPAGGAGEQFFKNQFDMEMIAKSESGQCQETIQRRAYLIWEQAGKPAGRALEHWVQAEAQLLAAVRRGTAPSEAVTQAGAGSNLAPRGQRYGLVLAQKHAG